MKQFYVNEIVTSNGVEQGLVHNEKHALHNIGVMYDESPTDELINMMKREAPFMVLKRFEKYLAVISCDQDGFRMNLISFRSLEDALEKFPRLREWPINVIETYTRLLYDIFLPKSDSEESELFLL